MGTVWHARVDPDTWEPMELGGQIVGEVHLVRAGEGELPYTVGLWRVLGDVPDGFDYAFAQDETIHVLEGEVEIAVDGGPTLHLGAGEVASFAVGTQTRWQIARTPFKELFVLS